MSEWKLELVVSVTIVLVLLVFFGAILIGQALRNDRAATVTPEEFTMTFVAPEGYSCFLDSNEVSINIVTVHCQP